MNAPGRRISVVMSAGSVNVAMVGFFLARAAHAENGYRKMQALAGKGVIGVDDDITGIEAGDGDDLRVPARGLGLEAHAFAQFHVGRKLVPGNTLDLSQITLSIGIGGLYDDSETLPGLPAFQRPLQARDDVAGAVEVTEAAIMGFIDDLPVISGQRVIEDCDAIAGNFHGYRFLRQARRATMMGRWRQFNAGTNGHVEIGSAA